MTVRTLSIPFIGDITIELTNCLRIATPQVERTGHGEICLDMGKLHLYATSYRGRQRERTTGGPYNEPVEELEHAAESGNSR